MSAGQLIAHWEQGIQRWLHKEPRRGTRDIDFGIDFGNGARLEAEDVLETHFQRLARSRRAQAMAQKTLSSRTCTVPIQVGDNLVAAIAVLAPQLAPLTELAEDVAETVAPVQPEQAFRTSLHHALEQTHRQYAAQRVLGTRQHQSLGSSLVKRWMVASATGVVLCGLLLGLWLVGRRLFK